MAQILSQVKLGTVTNVDLTEALTIGNTTIDGVIVNGGDRVLVKSQTDRKENGVYYVNTSGYLIRTSDFANASTQTPSTIIFIQQGDQLADTGWVLATDSNTNTLTVGTSELEFIRFSVNLNILGADLPSSIVLRSEKGYPLTNNELDNNFKFLSVSLSQKLNIADFTQTAICDRINSVSYSVADINSNKLQGFIPTSEYVQDTQTIVLRAQNGNITSPTFTGDLVGNADTASVATLAFTAHALDQVNSIQFGGTGSSTAAGARNNLNVVNRAGDSMTGKLSLAPAAAGYATLNIPAQSATISAPIDGDVWASSAQMFYKLSGNVYTFAPLQSPTFTGVPSVPTAEKTANSNVIASTQFVQSHVSDLNAAIALRATINSPTLTGEPRSTTPDLNENSTRIATTAYTTSKLSSALGAYSTTAETNASIAVALLNYYTKTQVDDLFSSNLANYYTRLQINTKLLDYYTKPETEGLVSTSISTAIANYYTKAQIDTQIALRATINSPTLTGEPRSTTPDINENSTRIATTAYTTSKLNSTLGAYSTTAETNASIAAALLNYYTKAQVDGLFASNLASYYTKLQIDTKFLDYYTKLETERLVGTSINTAIANYYTKLQIDAKFGDYYTKTETDTRINNAVSTKANTTYVDGLQDKWGSSRKFVQSSAPAGAVDGDIWFKI